MSQQYVYHLKRIKYPQNQTNQVPYFYYTIPIYLGNQTEPYHFMLDFNMKNTLLKSKNCLDCTQEKLGRCTDQCPHINIMQNDRDLQNSSVEQQKNSNKTKKIKIDIRSYQNNNNLNYIHKQQQLIFKNNSFDQRFVKKSHTFQCKHDCEAVNQLGRKNFTKGFAMGYYVMINFTFCHKQHDQLDYITALGYQDYPVIKNMFQLQNNSKQTQNFSSQQNDTLLASINSSALNESQKTHKQIVIPKVCKFSPLIHNFVFLLVNTITNVEHFIYDGILGLGRGDNFEDDQFDFQNYTFLDSLVAQNILRQQGFQLYIDSNDFKQMDENYTSKSRFILNNITSLTNETFLKLETDKYSFESLEYLYVGNGKIKLFKGNLKQNGKSQKKYTIPQQIWNNTYDIQISYLAFPQNVISLLISLLKVQNNLICSINKQTNFLCCQSNISNSFYPLQIKIQIDGKQFDINDQRLVYQCNQIQTYNICQFNIKLKDVIVLGNMMFNDRLQQFDLLRSKLILKNSDQKK